VKVSGLDASVSGRGFRFERREPQAIVLRGEDDVARQPIPVPSTNIVGLVAPVAAYLLIRTAVRRRRKT
jgi:hypothetical protein